MFHRKGFHLFNQRRPQQYLAGEAKFLKNKRFPQIFPCKKKCDV